MTARTPTGLLGLIPALAAACVAMLGALTLAGSALGIPLLTTFLPDAVNTKANTAVGFLLAGLALFLLRAPMGGTAAAGRLAAACVGGIGVLVLLQYGLHLDFGIDQLLFPDPVDGAEPFPGRPSPFTALNFVLIAAALLMLDSGRVGRALSQLLAVVVGGGGFIALLGYWYGVSALYAPMPPFTGVAPPTALALWILGFGLVFARPERGLAAMFVGPRPGPTLARWLAPVVVAAPLLFDFLSRLGYRNGLYAMESVTAVHALLLVIFFMVMVLLAARRIEHADDGRRDAEERNRFLAYCDPLTRLPNRARLRETLQAMLAHHARHRDGVAVLFVDLDQFKNVNESLGHHVGDLYLRAAGERIKSCVREVDVAGRLGGDEFVILLAGVDTPDKAAVVARKVLRRLAEPALVGTMELATSASIGIALCPDDGEDVDTLFKHADLSMYEAKANGRNTYQFYRPEMNEKAAQRLELGNSLRRALERREFVLYYQPQVDALNGRIVGAEALIRWRRPETGEIVSPDAFIGFAEENGLIGDIGEWVIHEACRQNKRWRDAGLLHIQVTANLSAVKLRQRNIPELVGRALTDSGLEPSALALELTESALMHEFMEAVDALSELKRMGVQIAVDDFGTGYSSLSYLKRFPIDKLKIDRSFVREVTTDPDDAAITSAIISMAKHMRLRVVAEGVETREQLEFLCARGCDEIQGYYFGRPMPADEMASLLAAAGEAHALPEGPLENAI